MSPPKIGFGNPLLRREAKNALGLGTYKLKLEGIRVSFPDNCVERIDQRRAKVRIKLLVGSGCYVRLAAHDAAALSARLLALAVDSAIQQWFSSGLRDCRVQIGTYPNNILGAVGCTILSRSCTMRIASQQFCTIH